MAKKKISPINEDFDFKLFVTIARQNMLWSFLLVFSAVIIAVLVLRYTAPVFEASTIIKIADENKAQNVLGISSTGQTLAENNQIAGDIELIRSKVIIERAVLHLPLQVSYYAKGAVLINELYKLSPFNVEFSIRDSQIFNTKFMIDFVSSTTIQISYIKPSTGERTSSTQKIGQWFTLPEVDLRISVINYEEIKNIQKEISNTDAYFFTLNRVSDISEDILNEMAVAVLNPDAKTILIKFKDKNPSKSADIINSVATEFIKYDVEKNSEVANKILDFIDNTIASIDLELSNSENSLESFKRSNKIISPELAITSVAGKLNELQTERYAIIHELTMYQKIRKDIGSNNDIGKFLLSLSGSNDNTLIVNQLARLQMLLDERDQIRIQATDNSEIYKAANLKVINQVALTTTTIENEESQLKSRLAEIDSRLSSEENEFGKIPGQQAEFGRLQRLFTINEKFYSMLLEKKAEFSITKAGYVPQHVILKEAKNNSLPVSPNRSLIISACLMLGFLASFILILTRYLLYNEINALEEIGLYTEATLLGIIPKYKREIPVSQLLVDKNPKSVISEAFRSIRTNLQFISNDEGAKMIAVTSTISGEGKTFIAINLAGVIAFSGKKVVILDLDMRKPKIHLGFNVENNHGMSTILIGKDTIEKCIIHSSLNNLDFITAGPIPPNPAELIINPKMNQLLETLRGIYDIIIVDLPPVGIVSDGIPMMQMADYPLYILRANYSRKMFIAQINKLISENKVKNLSVILNGVEMSKLKYGYGYGYSYGYGYGYGYSYGYGYYEEDDKPGTLIDKLKSFILRRQS